MVSNGKRSCGLLGIVLCVVGMLAHLLVAGNYSNGYLTRYKARDDDLYPVVRSPRHQKLWGPVNSLEALQPYSNPRNTYPVPGEQNGFIYAKIYGGFDMIRSSICDLVTISRMLNATLVIPEIQETLRSRGISSQFKSFSYLYNEEQFIAALSNDVVVVKSLPKVLKEARKKEKFTTFTLKHSASPSFYTREVLPVLKLKKVVGLLITNGGCLESILPPSLAEYQRLRCRVAFHALQFRPEIQALGNQIVERLRAFGRPYLAFHPGLVRDTLAFHGCAELFQDVHTELIQYKRGQMINLGLFRDDISIDSVARKRNGSCPLMPEEVGLLLRAMGYSPNTTIYIAGAETFGGQRVLIPLRAMYTNVVDRTSLCSEEELSNLVGRESPLPRDRPSPPPKKSEEELMEEWKKAGPRPRPLPPPPSRPFYQHEKEGWYGWVTETDKEPEPSAMDDRMQAHRLIWDALDYYVSVEADAFFPGFHNDGSGLSDFSSLVMGHRLHQTASGVTYRPDRKIFAELLETIHDNMYHPRRNWTALVRGHLNRSLGPEGLVEESRTSKPKLFLSHPLPECSCRTSYPPLDMEETSVVVGLSDDLPYGGEDECPDWMMQGLSMVQRPTTLVARDDDIDFPEDELDSVVGPPESYDGTTGADATRSSSEPDEEMDPDD